MRIYSWNVFCFNKRMPEVLSYIRRLDYDVLCLQEVTPELLVGLKQLPVHIAYHVDVIRLMSDSRRFKNYVVILSKHPFQHTGTLQFFDFPFPFHTRIFIWFMARFGWSFVTERGALYADIAYHDTELRIFSVHLTLWGPHNRAKEFEAVIGHVEPGRPAIIGGDFNVVEYGPMKLVNWLLGAPLAQGMPWYPERDIFEERFAEAGFVNPLRGTVTHRFSRSQLDHLLVSNDIEVEEASVMPERHGSDHQPVRIVIR